MHAKSYRCSILIENIGATWVQIEALESQLHLVKARLASSGVGFGTESVGSTG